MADLGAIEARAKTTAEVIDALRAEAREHGDDSYGYGLCRVLSVLPRGLDPDVTALAAEVRRLTSVALLAADLAKLNRAALESLCTTHDQAEAWVKLTAERDAAVARHKALADAVEAHQKACWTHASNCAAMERTDRDAGCFEETRTRWAASEKVRNDALWKMEALMREARHG